MLVSQRLVDLIERNADELANRWLRDVQKHKATPTYHSYNPTLLHQRAYSVYSQLGKWLSKDTTREEIAKYYLALGAKRRKEGFALSELVQALVITRRHVWLKVLEDGFLNTALDMHQALDLENRVVLFFDRAIYFAVHGYEE
jgi:hypothetical protein